MNPNDVVDIGSVLLVLGAGLLGMYVHYLTVKHKGRSDMPDWFYKYLITENPNNGKLQIVTFLSAMGALYSLGTFDLVNYDWFIEALKNGALFKPAISGIVTAIGTGYICDSSASKGAPKDVQPSNP